MPTDPAIREHCREIDRCNQRGGRMLSIVDLLTAHTLDFAVAAFLLDRISRGQSFLVGAMPGGAGKTTVMGALLNFLPPDVPIVPATESAVAEAGREDDPEPACYVCHEIGAGGYFAYLWGQAARDYFALPDRGHLLATNLHADTLEQCREQLRGDNGVPEAHFRRVRLMLFLDVRGSRLRPSRRIATVHASDGQGPHELVFQHTGDRWQRLGPPASDAEARCQEFLQGLLARPEKSIEAVRASVVEWLG